MTETEYITATNRLKITLAIAILRDVLPGFDGVTTKENMPPIMRQLIEMEGALFGKIKIQETPDEATPTPDAPQAKGSEVGK